MTPQQKNKPSSKHLISGQQAEHLACQYLQTQGLRLIEKNFRSRFGEIDLIMQHLDTLVFIEVRYRKNNHFGGAEASITPSKQHKLRKTALSYLQKKGPERQARFDVLAIHGSTGEDAQFNWIQNAF